MNSKRYTLILTKVLSIFGFFKIYHSPRYKHHRNLNSNRNITNNIIMVNINEHRFCNCTGKCKSAKYPYEKENAACHNCPSKRYANTHNLACSPLSICATIDTINESITSNIQFSESPLSDLSDNTNFSFDKRNTIYNNKSASSPSDDLSVGNRLITASDRIGNINDILNNLYQDVYEDNDGLSSATDDTFKQYYMTIAKSKNNIYELPKAPIG